MPRRYERKRQPRHPGMFGFEFAVRQGNADDVKECLKNGVDPNVGYGHHDAFIHNRMKIIDLLLEHGLTIKNAQNAFCEAVIRQYKELYPKLRPYQCFASKTIVGMAIDIGYTKDFLCKLGYEIL